MIRKRPSNLVGEERLDACLEQGRWAARDGGKGMERVKRSGILLHRCAGSSFNSKRMCAAVECATQLCIGRALLAGRGVRRLLFLWHLSSQNMAECVHGRAVLRKQQGEGKQHREQETHGLHGGVLIHSAVCLTG